MMDLAVKTSQKREVKEEFSRGDPVQRSLARHQVIVSWRVIAYYDLICASHFDSAAYEFAVESSIPNGKEARGSPI
jgi:hypothetical protein